jgi:hypothetical protein
VTRTRIAQVTAVYDLPPSPVPGPRGTHQVHHRYTAGPSEPSKPARRSAMPETDLCGRRAGHADPCCSAMRPRGQRDASQESMATPGHQEGAPRLPADSVGHAWARPGSPGDPAPGWRAPYPGRSTSETGGTSGSVNRSLRPDSVRHMSVTTAMQGLTAAHHETRWDNSKAAREPGYAQATGRFRR